MPFMIFVCSVFIHLCLYQGKKRKSLCKSDKMEEIDANTAPTNFLDDLVKSVHGVKKIYISDMDGAILAESSELRSESEEKVVRSFPTYYERLGKLSYGSSKSIVVECENSLFVLFESQNFLITFICERDANVALLSEFPNEMNNFLTQLRSFVEA